MSASKQVITINDSVGFVLSEAELTGKKVGEFLLTRDNEIPCSDGIKWWVKGFPAGKSKEDQKHISLYLYVSKMVSAKFKFYVVGSSIQDSMYHDFVEHTGCGFPTFASHEMLQPLFVDGKLVIACEADFTFSVPFVCPMPRLTIDGYHVPTDFELVVGTKQVKVHRSLLSLISPVFYHMLSHDTVESKLGKIEITDFDFEIVDGAINLCYGSKLGTPSIEIVVGVLRFADKYGMESVTNQFAKIPRFNLSIETFPTIVHYAYDCFESNLFDECCTFFKEHQKLIFATEKFCQLPPSLVARLVKKTFDLKMRLDVLPHAHANGIDFILNPLEQRIIKGLSLDTFCKTVSYVWECSRDDQKDACAKFFNDNQAEIKLMKEFYELPPQVTHGVMKLGYEISIADQ
uniref:BTB domain-containing protein n=1 Tax=Panagrellus redivivus TaxID=6233 RepID=A0A7E4VUB8_PANRE